MTDTDQLHRAVAGLTETTRIRLWREDTKRSEWQTIPSLWNQLQAAVGYSGGSGGTSVAKSRPTINSDVVRLIIEIAEATAEAALDIAKTSHRDAAANLRAIAANITEHELIQWWEETVRRWIRETRSILRLDPQRPRWARGIRCPDCQADTTTTNLDGEQVRTPALAITWGGPEDNNQHHSDEDWKVRAIECRACGSVWWRGPDMETLVDRMLKDNTSKETLAISS